MSKGEMIQQIMGLNRSATTEFLDQFRPGELLEYLQRLLWLRHLRGPNLLKPETDAEILALLETRCPLHAN